MPLANSVARLLRETPQTTASHPLPLYNRILWDCGRHQGAVMVAYCNATSNALNIDWLRKFDNDATMFESYFASIYGGSAIVAPVQLEFVYNSVPLRSSFSALWTCTICTPYRQYGWLWAPLQDAVLNPSHLSDRLQPTPPSFNISFARLRTEDAKRRGVSVMSDESNGHSAFPGFFIHRLNGSCQHAFCDDRSHRKPVPDNAWVEVMRISRFESNTLASERCTIGQVFYWVAFGSGIWINVGRSVRPSRPQSPREHIDWTHRWNCDRAHELGFDTIQRLGDFLLSSSTAVDSLSVRPEPMRPSGRTHAHRNTPSCGRAECLWTSSLRPCICLRTRGSLTRRIRVRVVASATRPWTTSIVDWETKRGARQVGG